MVKSLALFVNALHQSDQQFVALNNDLAQFTNAFTNTDREVADALQDLNELLTTTRGFIEENGGVLAHDVNNLADATNAILQPEPRDGLETVLHVFPNLAANLVNISTPNGGGGVVSVPVIANFANPMEFICSSIQAGSRLGYQESAELCAQYLGPILDAIKFNYLPFGANQLQTAMTLPKQIAYSEAAAAAAAGLQGHHRAGHLLPRHPVLARQPRTGLDRRARYAGRRRTAAHREHADTGIAGRTDGRPRHRGTPRTAGLRRQRREAARAAERLWREHPAATSVVPAAGATARTGAGRHTRRPAQRAGTWCTPGPRPCACCTGGSTAAG